MSISLYSMLVHEIFYLFYFSLDILRNFEIY
jgi:hypothetical protein